MFTLSEARRNIILLISFVISNLIKYVFPYIVRRGSREKIEGGFICRPIQ